jgi:hypothetical protein
VNGAEELPVGNWWAQPDKKINRQARAADIFNGRVVDFI